MEFEDIMCFDNCCNSFLRWWIVDSYFRSKTCEETPDLEVGIVQERDYTNAVFRFYTERKPEAMLFSSTSGLKSSASVDLNDKEMEDEDDNGDIMVVLQEVEVEHEPTTNDDVPDDVIPLAQQIDTQKTCGMVLGIKSPVDFRFLGYQPFLLGRTHSQILKQHYFTTWKADWI
jgi:hypothetical protein